MRVVAVRAEGPQDVIWLDEAPRNEAPVKAKQKVHAWHNKIGRNTTKRGTSNIEQMRTHDVIRLDETQRNGVPVKAKKKARTSYPIASSSGPPVLRQFNAEGVRVGDGVPNTPHQHWAVGGQGGGGGLKASTLQLYGGFFFSFTGLSFVMCLRFVLPIQKQTKSMKSMTSVMKSYSENHEILKSNIFVKRKRSHLFSF